MEHTFTGDQAVELAVVERNEFIESRHLGSAVVLDTNGDVLRSFGTPGGLIFPRSTLKPLQAVALLNKQLDLEGEHIALMCASHTGTPQHINGVRAILSKYDVPENALRCPSKLPLDDESRNQIVLNHQHSSPIYMMCSGKHAAMLATCRINDLPLEQYCNSDHPLQVHVRETIERLSGERITKIAVDGCSAPTFSLSLTGLAKSIHRIRTASLSSPFALFKNSAKVQHAMLSHAWAIEGPNKPDTVVAERLGVLSKSGAEGVLVLSAPNATTVAIKVLDGSSRAAMLVGLSLLAQTKAIHEKDLLSVLPSLKIGIKGGNTTVGMIRNSISMH